MPPDKLKEIIRANIKVRRAQLVPSLTQAGLAERIGTTQAAVAQIERGHTSVSIEMLAKIADALETQPSLMLTKDAFALAAAAT